MKNAVGRDIPEALLVNGKEVYQGKNYMDGKYLQKAAPRTRRYEKPQESKIVETLADALGQNRDIDAATEQVRGALARTITRRFCEDGQLRVVTLDAEVERKIISSLTRSEQGVYLALGSDLMQQIITQVADYVRKFNELSQPPILLVSQVIRGYFSRMITQFYPNVYVLSFNEVTSSVQIQAIGNITQEAPVRKAVGT